MTPQLHSDQLQSADTWTRAKHKIAELPIILAAGHTHTPQLRWNRKHLKLKNRKRMKIRTLVVETKPSTEDSTGECVRTHELCGGRSTSESAVIPDREHPHAVATVKGPPHHHPLRRYHAAPHPRPLLQMLPALIGPGCHIHIRNSSCAQAQNLRSENGEPNVCGGEQQLPCAIENTDPDQPWESRKNAVTASSSHKSCSFCVYMHTLLSVFSVHSVGARRL